MGVRGRFELAIDDGDMGRNFTHIIISTFVAPLSPALRRLTSLGATISRTMAGYVIRKCGSGCNGVCVDKGVSNSIIGVAVHSGNYNVSSVTHTVAPLFAAKRNRHTKLNFAIVRDFYSGVSIHSTVKGNADIILIGGVRKGSG